MHWSCPSCSSSVINAINSVNVNVTHTHTFNSPFPGLPGWAGTRKVKPIRILLKQETVSGSGISRAVCKSAPRSRQWVAVASAGPYASLHLAPDRQPYQHPTTQSFTGRMPFLPPNQQRQSTSTFTVNIFNYFTYSDIAMTTHNKQHFTAIIQVNLQLASSSIWKLWPAVSQLLHLKTGGFWWCKVLLPVCPCKHNDKQ